jgi:glycosyltransferase involved in cell wall biosynthesis
MSSDSPSSLSVITPSFEYGRFLRTCLRSVHSQTSAWDLQHVVVDDASTDDSWDVLQQEHPKLDDVHRHRQNLGLSPTLTEAFRLPSGDVVCWINADDFHLPWAYAEVLRAFRANPEATVVFGDTVFVDDESRVLRLVPQPRFDRRVMEGGFNMFHVPSVFFRRSAVPTDFSFDASMKLYMDLDLWLTVTSGPAVVVKTDTVLSAFRRHPGQVSAVRRPSEAGEVRTLSARHHLRALGKRQRGGWTRSAHGRHAVGKLLDGAVLREMRVRPVRGHDVDWTAGASIPEVLRPAAAGPRLLVTRQGAR